MNMRQQGGFSLIELAIVILIMGLVLGGIAMPLSVQRENARIKQGDEQIAMVQSAIEGFALANGRLPCPATPASDGVADPSGGGCTTQHGFVPATTLNLHGSRNDDNLLLDPWGAPLRYSVTASDADTDGNWDFTVPGEMRDVTMALLQPDIHVCSSA
nr:type II secretion system protein [Woeseiaceae bacterium]